MASKKRVSLPRVDPATLLSNTRNLGAQHKEEQLYNSKAEQVRENYLSDAETGVASAVRDALKSLFSEPRLPDNPYFYLANVLNAYVDQSQLWKESNATVTSAYDLEGAVEVMYQDSKLSKLSNTNDCWGLPHVLRLVSKEGVRVLNEVLADGLPDTFFPTSLPFGTHDGYAVQVFASVHGVCASWRPQALEFPELTVRSDVLVKGAKLEEAVKIFIDLIITEMEDMHAVPVYFVEGLTIKDSPSTLYEGTKEPFSQFFPREEILAKPEEFEKTAMRLVLGNKVLCMASVVLLDTPTSPSDLSIKKLRYELTRKEYFFHYQSLEQSRPGLYDQTSHYGCLPYEALYSGYFMDAGTARQYMAMYVKDFKEPYAKQNLADNSASLKRQCERGLNGGDGLEAFRTLLWLVMLQDTSYMAPGVGKTTQELLPLEYLTATDKSKGGKALTLGSVPNLLRIINSAAAVIEGIVHELEAVSTAAQRWPAKLALIKNTALKTDSAHAWRPRSDGVFTAPGTGDSRRTLRTAEIGNAMLTWLKTFNMDHRLNTQLYELRNRIYEAAGKGLFSGISIMVETLLRKLPGKEAVSSSTTFLLAAPGGTGQQVVALGPVTMLLRQLLYAASMTVAHGFLGCCSDVLLTLQELGIKVRSMLDMHQLNVNTAYEDEVYSPDWVLEVKTVTESKVRSGGVAARVASEGVMLQYAVDTKLDELLASLWLQLTEPPLPLNPYPRMMHIIRARAAKLELWKEDLEEALASLCNDLSLLRPPCFIYAARPPSNVYGRPLNQGVSADVKEDEDLMVAYGSYAAVALVDPRAVQALRNGLAQVLCDRNWQQGAYAGEVVPALLGDVCLSNALQLRDVLLATQHRNPSHRRKVPAPYEHPRYYSVEAEEHHLVWGPKRKAAAQTFAQDVVSSLESLHTNTLHLVHQLVLGEVRYSLRELLSGEGSRAKVVDALAAAAYKQPQGSHLACVHIYAATRENMYVWVRKWLVFQHGKVLPPLVLNTSVTTRAGPESCSRPSTADMQKMYWDRAAYQRVFLSEFNALTWYSWNRTRGDPAQPFHYMRMLQESTEDLRRLRGDGRVLEMLKLLLCCATASQDDEGIYQFSRSCMSTSQELQCLQDMNMALVAMLDEANPLEFSRKVDNERLRKLFLMYCSRMRKAMTSAKYNYFTGLAVSAPHALAELREHVLSTFKLGGRHMEIMQQLAAWTEACEISVAAAVYDCLDAEVTKRIGTRHAPAVIYED